MSTVKAKKKKTLKILSGISGFDDIARGGIPKGRTTLVSGTSGSGKTVFCAQFLYKGMTDFGEPGVFVTFEERPVDIIKNMEGFGWDIDRLVAEGKWVFVDASPDEAQSLEAGAYDLGAFLARIEYAVRKVHARRVAIDSVSALFTQYEDPALIRRELYRLAFTLKELGTTCLLTAERPNEDGAITRFGVEEFVSDNVIILHNRLNEKGQRNRTIEILKFRGSAHDSEEAPLLVDKRGVSVYPRPKPVLRGKGFEKRLSVGVKGLDDILGGGVYKNSTTLISGASGTGKTVAVMHFVIAAALRGEKALLIEFEESPEQLYRNARSFGWNLKKLVEDGVVKLVCHYPEGLRAEQYFRVIQGLVTEHNIQVVGMDSLSALERIYSTDKFREFVVGLNGFLKMKNCTTLFANTTTELLGVSQITETHLSTATDNVILLKYVELGGVMRRLLTVLKQRGSAHRKELVEFEVGRHGINIIGPFKGVENLLSGSARILKIDFGEKEAEKEAEKEFMEEIR